MRKIATTTIATTLDDMSYQLDHVTVSRSGTIVLQDLCLNLPRGRMTGVIGPNGAGKSTLLAALAGDIALDQGRLLLDGQSIVSGLPIQRARQRAMLSQQAEAIFNLTVGQTLGLGLYAFSHWSGHDRTVLIEEVSRTTDIAAWLDRPMTALSVGQQQRVHFGRAVLQALAALKDQGVAWLLLDEPTASQDPLQQQLMLSICRNCLEKGPIGILLVMHDLTLAAQWCDDIIILKDRTVLAHGQISDVLTPNLLGDVYGNQLSVQVIREPAPGVIMSLR